MSINANNTAISPKEYTMSAILNKSLTAEKRSLILKHYFKHINYYKKNAQPTIPEKSVANQVALAESIFASKAEDK